MRELKLERPDWDGLDMFRGTVGLLADAAACNKTKRRHVDAVRDNMEVDGRQNEVEEDEDSLVTPDKGKVERRFFLIMFLLFNFRVSLY